MATWQSRIEGYVGSIASYTTQANEWLKLASVKLLQIARIDDPEITYVENNDATVPPEYSRVMYAIVSSKRCKYIPHAHKSQYISSDSLLYATSFSPVFYIGTDGKVNTFPAGGKYYTIVYSASTVVGDTEAGLFGSGSLASLAVIDCAIQYLQYLIDATTTKPSTAIVSLPPTLISAPSFTSVITADFAYSNIVGNAALSLATQYTQLSTQLDTNEDIELANTKINELQTRIQEWNATAQEVLARLKSDKEIGLSSVSQKYASLLAQEVQAYDATVKKFAQDLNEYQAKVQAEIATIQANVQLYNMETQAKQSLIAGYKSKIEILQASYALLLKTYSEKVMYGNPN